MAKKGFMYAVVAPLNVETGKHEKGMALGPTSKFNVNPTTSDVKDYGDNRVTETDTSVTGGTTALEINEFTNEIYGMVLGHEYDKEKDIVKCNKADIAPFVGLGAIGISKHNNKDKYTAKWYNKTQFKEPNDENNTQQENVTFEHTTLEGNLFVPEDGAWKEQQTFLTFEEAKTWLNEKAGIVVAGAAGEEEPGLTEAKAAPTPAVAQAKETVANQKSIPSTK